MRRLLIPIFVLTLLSGCDWADPTDVGLIKGELHGCPQSHTCVSTAGEKAHYVAPILVKSSASDEKVMSALKKALESLPGAKLRHTRPNYLWFTFKNKLGFVDDIEVLYQPDKHEVAFRSASRVGFHDLGQNKAHYNALRCQLKDDKLFKIEGDPCVKRRFNLW